MNRSNVFRAVRSSRFVAVVAVLVIVIFVWAFAVPFLTSTGSDSRRLTTSSYLAQFTWSFPGGQSPPFFSGEERNELNPGCKKPRSLSAYKPVETSSLLYVHPPIVHFAKIFSPAHAKSSEELSYKEYLSMLSYYKFLKPKLIVLHSNIGVHGKYWAETQSWTGTKVVLIKVPPISKLQNQDVIFWAHVADYVKISALLEYGGIASDFDVIFLKGDRYREASQKVECILACEGKGDECSKINGGFYSCSKNSLYMLNWLKSYHFDYKPWEWVYNAGDIPTQLLTNNSSLCYNVMVDETISKDPIFEESEKWLKEGGVDWKSKMVTHYYLRYETSKLPSDEAILKLDNSYGQMLRYVVESK